MMQRDEHVAVEGVPSSAIVQSVTYDVSESIEQLLGSGGPDSKSGISRRKPNEEIVSAIQCNEALWQHLATNGAKDANDRFFTEAIADVDVRIKALEAELQAARQTHRRGRAALLNELCVRRRRAAGIDKTSSSIMLPAQATSAVADAEAKGQQQAAAQDAVRLRPWLVKEVSEGASIEEGEVRVTLDHNQLLDLDMFDPSEPCRSATEAARATVWARLEAQKAAWSQAFEEEKGQLEAKVREVRKQDQVDQKKHEALVAALMAKFEAHQEVQRKEAAVGCRAKPKVEGLRGSLRASLFGGRAPAPVETQASPSGGRKSRGATASSIESNLDLMRDIFGPPLSEQEPVNQWGATLVNQLGLNFSPSKPRGFGNSMSRCRRMRMGPPRVARSIEEAFSVGPESEESIYLSRYMLGNSRMATGQSDQQHSPPVSPPASTMASSVASRMGSTMSPQAVSSRT